MFVSPFIETLLFAVDAGIPISPTGFEPVTSGLEDRYSSTELRGRMASSAGVEPAVMRT